MASLTLSCRLSFHGELHEYINFVFPFSFRTDFVYVIWASTREFCVSLLAKPSHMESFVWLIDLLNDGKCCLRTIEGGEGRSKAGTLINVVLMNLKKISSEIKATCRLFLNCFRSDTPPAWPFSLEVVLLSFVDVVNTSAIYCVKKCFFQILSKLYCDYPPFTIRSVQSSMRLMGKYFVSS